MQIQSNYHWASLQQNNSLLLTREDNLSLIITKTQVAKQQTIKEYAFRPALQAVH